MQTFTSNYHTFKLRFIRHITRKHAVTSPAIKAMQKYCILLQITMERHLGRTIWESITWQRTLCVLAQKETFHHLLALEMLPWKELF